MLSVLSFTINPFYSYLSGDRTATISDYFNLTDLENNLVGNRIAFWILSALSIIGIIAGVIKMISKVTKKGAK